MATNPTLTVILSPTAENELWGIWRSNLDRYDFDHAEDYEAFLKQGVNALADTYDNGRPVEGYPELQYVTLKRNRRGDGHYVIYEVDQAQGTIHIHHVFHTKMDVKGRLENEHG